MGWLYSSVGKSSSSVSSEKTAGYNSSLQGIDLHNCLIYCFPLCKYFLFALF